MGLNPPLAMGLGQQELLKSIIMRNFFRTACVQWLGVGLAELKGVDLEGR